MPDTTSPKPVPANLDEFDLDAFIDGVVQPSKVVAVAQDRTLGQQLQEAMQAVLDLQADEVNAKAEGRPSKRRAATEASPELEAARQRLDDLEKAAQSTFVFVRIESLSRDVRNQAIKDAGPTGSVELYNQSALAHCAKVYKTDPRTHPDAPAKVLSSEQWGVMSTAIGALQWDALLAAITEVTEAGVEPDFSQPASPSPDGATFSKS